MQRRAFISAFGSTLALWPHAARAQPVKRPIVGFLIPGTRESHGTWVAAFTKRMEELGWTDGRTVTLEYRWAEGHLERYPDITAEFARLGVDVMVSSTGAVVPASLRAAPNTPVVLSTINTGSSFIASLAHPGGMVTGLSQMGSELGGKRLGLLAEMLPGLRRVAMMGVAGGSITVPEAAVVQAAATARGIEVMPLIVKNGEDIAPAIMTVKGKAEALYVIIDPLISVHQAELNRLALEARLPTLHGLRAYVLSGGLMSYGVDFEDQFRRSANYVDKILRGAKPGDLPVEQPTRFEFVINLKTAQALGLTVPTALLAGADELIE